MSFPRFAVASSLLLLSSPLWALTINTVPIGNPGNSPDSTGFGAVPYNYRIGTTEITNAQYTEFLNAVAASDTHQLYDSRMGDPDPALRGGIIQSGTSGSFSYEVRPNFGNKPVNYVSFWDAARFANWLQNGQPTGPQNLDTTEGGAYSLNGITNPLPQSIARSPNTNWFLPTENEWYKAGYHQPFSDGGDADDFWLYPTAANSASTIAAANSVGDISNPGPNVANYEAGADWDGQNGNVTTVGTAGPLSASFYGTFDQGGNVWEWNEATVNTDFRGIRGGARNNVAENLSSLDRGFAEPSLASGTIGFRVAFIPEPASAVLLTLVGLLLSVMRLRR